MAEDNPAVESPSQKVVVCMIGENEEKALRHSIPSFINKVDAFVYVDGGSKDDSVTVAKTLGGQKLFLIESPFQHANKGANGIQRNIYLEYAKKNFPGWLCLVVDPDEVVSGNLAFADHKNNNWNIPMDHFIGNLGRVDATLPSHVVLRRLFIVTPDVYYPLEEHCVLQGPNLLPPAVTQSETCKLWHLGYARNMYTLLDRIHTHKEKSIMHNKRFLDDWYHGHLLGYYPTRPFDFHQLPNSIRETFEINTDFLYFKGRETLQANHFIDAIHWKHHFKPESVLEVGCGMGPRIAAMKMLGLKAEGFDVSRYAVENNPFGLVQNKDIWVGNIVDEYVTKKYDLVVAYDLLEHLSLEELELALDKLKQYGKDFLFSMPFLGDPNLDADPTHKIKQSRTWWIEKLVSKGFSIETTPSFFQFNHQLIVAKVKA